MRKSRRFRYDTDEPVGQLERVRTAAQRFEASQRQPVEVYRWTPNRRVYRRLPRNLHFDLLLGRTADGRRTVTPAAPPQNFLFPATLCGNAMLRHGRSVESSTEYIIGMFQLCFFQWSFNTRLPVGGRFSAAERLHVVGRAEREIGRSTLVPDIVLPGQSSAACISPKELVSAGRDHARDRRRYCRDDHDAIVEGLLHYAEHVCSGVTSVQEQTVDHSLRNDIFFSPDAHIIPEETHGLVVTRLYALAMKNSSRLRDDFRRWHGQFDRRVSQIAALKPKIDSEIVRAVLIDNIWHSYKEVSDSLLWAIASVNASLELTAEEQELMWHRYVGRDQLGDIAPVVLHNRQEFIDRTLMDIENRSGEADKLWQALRLALYWFARMLEWRRKASLAEKRPAAPQITSEVPVGGSVESARRATAAHFRVVDDELDSR